MKTNQPVNNDGNAADQRGLKYKEAANRLGVAPVTLRRWVGAKRLKVCRYSPTCVRIPLEEIERLEREALV